MTPQALNTLAATVYAQNVERGWWDDPNRCVYRTLQLVNTEVAEATEGDRKNLMDDHLPQRKMVEVEMADVLIRLLDLAGHYKWSYDALAAPYHLLPVCHNLGAMHLAITAAVCNIGEWCINGGAPSAGWAYSVAVSTVLAVARHEGYDLDGAIAEKLAYNRTRVDHSREARAHFDGKAY